MANLNKRVIIQGVGILMTRISDASEYDEEFTICIDDSYDIRAMVNELNKLLLEGKQ